MGNLPFNLTKDDVKTIVSTAYNISRHVPRGGLWSEVAEHMGEAEYLGEKVNFPYKLDYFEEEDMLEDVVAFCRSKDGKIYVKTLEDYAEQKLREEGIEPTEDEITEYAMGFCDKGECNPPDDICGCDEYFGDLHTHPNYPVSPSCQDLKHVSNDKLRVMCISSKGSFACLFLDPDNLQVPCRTRDIYNRLCIPVVVEKEDAMGIVSEEEYNLCPEEFIRGYEREWIQDVRRLIRDGAIRGVCYHIKGDQFTRDRVICDFGEEFIDFKVSELE